MNSPVLDLKSQLVARNLTLATAESCTAGFIAASIARLPGASEFLLGGSVTHCNAEKIRLGVDQDLIDKHTEVSADVAHAMAMAIIMRTGANVGVATTGFFGKSSYESVDDGTVWVSVVIEDKLHEPNFKWRSRKFILPYEEMYRSQMQGFVADKAFGMVLELLGEDV